MDTRSIYNAGDINGSCITGDNNAINKVVNNYIVIEIGKDFNFSNLKKVIELIQSQISTNTK